LKEYGTVLDFIFTKIESDIEHHENGQETGNSAKAKAGAPNLRERKYIPIPAISANSQTMSK
jgi:hypothetical protein